MARKDDPVTLAERQIVAPHERPCDYCGERSEGSVNGRSACGKHFLDALDGAKPMQEVRLRA